jgi:hypothetical protein
VPVTFATGWCAMWFCVRSIVVIDVAAGVLHDYLTLGADDLPRRC